MTFRLLTLHLADRNLEHSTGLILTRNTFNYKVIAIGYSILVLQSAFLLDHRPGYVQGDAFRWLLRSTGQMDSRVGNDSVPSAWESLPSH